MLFEAWDRYKKMLYNCLQLDLNDHQEIQTFYSGINICRQLVES